MTTPEKSAALLQQGLYHHRQGQFPQAMERYVEVLQGDPQNADALYYIAVLVCQDEQYQEGIRLARRSLTFAPGRARAHNLIGQALQRLGEAKNALASFDDALQCDAKFAEAYGNRANVLTELGRPVEALSSLDRAVELNPNSLTDWLNRGTVLHDLGRTDEAIQSYDRAIALDAKFGVPHFNRATALMAQGRADEGIAAFDRAIALKPDFIEAHLARAAALKGWAGSTRRLPTPTAPSPSPRIWPPRIAAAPTSWPRSAAPTRRA